MTFWYHMYGSSIGSLNVYLNVSNRLTLWWRKSGNKGNAWKQGMVGIGKKTQPFQVLFQGKIGLPAKCLELNTGKDPHLILGQLYLYSMLAFLMTECKGSLMIHLSVYFGKKL